MVNSELKRAADGMRPVMGRRKPAENLGFPASMNPLANDSNLPKIPASFALNVAQKREQPLQPCLLACVMRRNHNSRPRRLQAAPEGIEQGYGTGVMFFLLRVAFWLTIVLALLPTRRRAAKRASAQVGADRCGGRRGRRGFRHGQLLRAAAGGLRRRRAGRGRDRPARPGRRQDGLRVLQRSCLARQRDRLGRARPKSDADPNSRRRFARSPPRRVRRTR